VKQGRKNSRPGALDKPGNMDVRAVARLGEIRGQHTYPHKLLQIGMLSLYLSLNVPLYVNETVRVWAAPDLSC
jgi:hypothetical protein